MCGLCGVVAFDRPPELELARAMANVLAHRGPDGEGSFAAEPGVAFGHRRLAIIDLSDAGIQPFASDDGQLQLLHNGEIYNYRELRQELEGRGHRFHTATDTEVVLHAYEEWGDRCVERFNGMWAIALWDGRRERLFCSRDRFGVKPFYYRFDNGRFVFASELKAFRVDSSTPLRPNLDAVRDYLEQGALDHRDSTFFEGIRKLEPAHSLVFDREGLRTSRYWTLEVRDCAERPGRRGPRALPRLRPASPAQRRPDRDLPLGRASTRRRSPARSTTCSRPRSRTRGRSATGSERSPRTSRTQGFDERPFALEVVRKTNADPHWISFTDEDLVEYLPAIVDGPGRAVRLDEHRRAVVPDARRARGRAQGDARRARRGRGTRRLSDVLLVPLRRLAHARPRSRRSAESSPRTAGCTACRCPRSRRRCSARSPPSA